MGATVDGDIISRFKDRLDRIALCERVGITEKVLGLPNALQVPALDEALALAREGEWEAVTLEAQNRLGDHLRTRAPEMYRAWNEWARRLKTEAILQVVPMKIAALPLSDDSRRLLLDLANWDLLGAGLEIVYESARPPNFFSALLKVYEAGHLPCGWQGQWPAGNLLYV